MARVCETPSCALSLPFARTNTGAYTVTHIFFLPQAPEVLQKLMPVSGAWPAAPSHHANEHTYTNDTVLPVQEDWFRSHNTLDTELYNYILSAQEQRARSLADSQRLQP